MSKHGVSALIIANNSESTILKTINSVIAVTDEVIIVDTGSTDNTLNVIPKENVKIKVYNYKWEDNFSKARNYSIDLASGPYCIVIDADEYLTDESRDGFREKILSLFFENKFILYAPVIDNLNGFILRNNARIFMKRPTLRYKGLVHEYLYEKNCKIKHANEIIINHTGYLDRKHLDEKRERNLRLLKRQLKETPAELRWKYFMLRYFDSRDENFEKILYEFGEVTLPYSLDIEIYALNAKSRLVIHLLDKYKFEEACFHAKCLFNYYKDKNSYLLYFISMYLMSMTRYQNDMRRLKKIYKDINKYPRDELISETINEEATSSVINKFLYDLDHFSDSFNK